MDTIQVPVPSLLLLSRELSPSAKVVWVAVRLVHLQALRTRHGENAGLGRNAEPRGNAEGAGVGRRAERTGQHALPPGQLPIRPAVISVTEISAQTGLSRPTVRRALRELEEKGWFEARHRAPGSSGQFSPHLQRVMLPEHLIGDAALHPAAKLLYGILMLLAQQSGSSEKHYVHSSGLQQLTGWSLKRVRHAVRTLAETGWIEVKQAHRLAPFHYEVVDPLKARSIAELERAKKRIGKAKFLGEALMREYLSLLIDCDVFEDDAAPGFLVNPVTNERLQFDRFYPPRVAFEFNGPQHYVPTEVYSAEQVAWQRARDFIKLGICATRGIVLCIIHPEDLSLNAMKEKVGTHLPLRDLRHEGPRIAYLESIARTYRRAARRSLRRHQSDRPSVLLSGGLSGKLPHSELAARHATSEPDRKDILN